MFKFAGDAATSHVVSDILKPEGIFADRAVLTSANGARFLSTLAEANSGAVLKLLEGTVGLWSDKELLDFKEERQSIVWALEKIAVWPTLTVRSIKVLARLASNENANFSNNATGTLVGLFRIGPEAAATEASPEARLPALLALMRSRSDGERRLALKAAHAALYGRGTSFRIVGPEYQGLKGRAKLWMPTTYGDLWRSWHLYFQSLVEETRSWPEADRPDVCQALLDAVEHQIQTPLCTELALEVLGALIDDPAMSPRQLNRFFWHWQEYEANKDNSHITSRVKAMARRYTRRDLASRVRRYVIDVDWMEWDDDFRDRHDKAKSRVKLSARALARRIARSPDSFREVEHLLVPTVDAPGLWFFGEELGAGDEKLVLLPALARLADDTKHHLCLHAYLSSVGKRDPELYRTWIRGALGDPGTAWLGATLTLRSDYVDELFDSCLGALDRGWIEARLFASLRFGKAIDRVPLDRAGQLLRKLDQINSAESLFLAVELMDSMAMDASFPCGGDFAFSVLVRTIPAEDRHEQMHGFHWKNVCAMLVKWEPARAKALLDALLTAMGKAYRLSYDSNVAPLADDLARMDVHAAWEVVRLQFEAALPEWRSDLLSWLKGGLVSFDEKEPKAVVADLPVADILEWIALDSGPRAPLVAHATVASLDDEHGGHLTRELLSRYGTIDGVRDGIRATFHSGGWTGPTSAHLRRKREKLRRWLAAGLDGQVMQWIEGEIEYLDRSIEREDIDEERSRFD